MKVAAGLVCLANLARSVLALLGGIDFDFLHLLLDALHGGSGGPHLGLGSGGDAQNELALCSRQELIRGVKAEGRANVRGGASEAFVIAQKDEVKARRTPAQTQVDLPV